VPYLYSPNIHDRLGYRTIVQWGTVSALPGHARLMAIYFDGRTIHKCMPSRESDGTWSFVMLAERGKTLTNACDLPMRL
jgi:hypothetical protein